MVVIEDIGEANRCIRELAALSLLPAIWGEGQPEQIRDSLADALQNSLRPDLVYVRGKDGKVSETMNAAFRSKEIRLGNGAVENLRDIVERNLGDGGSDLVECSFQGVSMRLAVIPLGVSHEFGVLAVGSQRTDFPNAVERLLLNVSVNQAIIAFRSAKQLTSLKRSESNLRDFFENATIGLHWVDASGTIIWANQTELTMLGYSREEYIGHSITEFHADGCVIQDILSRLGGGESLHDYEARLRCKDGSVLLVLIDSNVLFEKGEFIHTRCFTRDISERKRAEQALSEASEHRRLALEAAALGSWDYRFDLGTIFWDERCRNMWGLSEGSKLDFESVIDRLHREDRDRTKDAVEAALRGVDDGMYQVEFRVVRPDDSVRWVSSKGQVYFNERNGREPLRFIGTTRDVTEEKGAQEALREAQAELRRHAETLEQQVTERTSQLRETIQELEAFSYSVSHDMRSPLRAMQGYSDALLEEYKDRIDEKGVDYLKRIRRSASKMDVLIQDVLAYSRVAKGDIHLNEVNVENVIRDVIQNYPLLQPDRTDISVISPIPRILGHESYLTQIVSNLLSNAVKFVEPGKRPSVIIQSIAEGEMVRISFEDNGIGISLEHQQQIFQIFGRVYSEKKFEGTGIGLAIVKKATERMGGRSGVESQGGSGSKFFVILKRAH